MRSPCPFQRVSLRAGCGLKPSLRSLVRRRDVIGSDTVIGDDRWAGAWGVRADFIAKTVCSAIFLPSEDVHVRARRASCCAVCLSEYL